MIAVFIGFAFAGMPLVAQLGVACAVAIAVDATVVRLVLVPALMAMFDEWNWWLPRWLAASCRRWTSRSRCPRSTSPTWSSSPTTSRRWAPLGADHAHGGQVRGQAENLAPRYDYRRRSAGAAAAACRSSRSRWRAVTNGHTSNGRCTPATAATNGSDEVQKPDALPVRVHPVTIWRGRLSVALDALETEADSDRPPVERQQPDGDHQRPAADGRPAADPDRRGNAAAEELPGHVPKHAPRISRSLPSWSTRWRLKLLRWCWRQWTGTTVETAQGNNGSPPSWCAAWPIHNRPTSTTPGCRALTAEADWAKVRGALPIGGGSDA